MTKLKITDDATIQAARAAYARALNRPELRAARLVLHEAYNDRRDEERRAAAAARHYADTVDPRGLGRIERRVAESEERAQEVRARWATLMRAYLRSSSTSITWPASTSAPAAAMNLPGDLPPLGLRSLLRVVIPLTAWAHSHIGRWARFEMGDEQRATMNLLLSGLLDVHMHAARLEYLVQPKTVAATDGA